MLFSGCVAAQSVDGSERGRDERQRPEQDATTEGAEKDRGSETPQDALVQDAKENDGKQAVAETPKQEDAPKELVEAPMSDAVKDHATTPEEAPKEAVAETPKQEDAPKELVEAPMSDAVKDHTTTPEEAPKEAIAETPKQEDAPKELVEAPKEVMFDLVKDDATNPEEVLKQAIGDAPKQEDVAKQAEALHEDDAAKEIVGDARKETIVEDAQTEVDATVKDPSVAVDGEEKKREHAAIVIQSFWRRKRDRRLFEMQSKRARVAKELLDTEQTYVSSLEMMIRLYMKPLLASARSTDPIMPRAKVQAIFSVVEVMTNLNKVLLEDLKKRLDCWHVDQVLGDIFLSMGDYLKIATQFVNNYETAVSTISGELKANPRFKLFYDEMRETPECKKNDLKAFLIMPVQRIPRYEMLLRELIRKTPSQHPDSGPLNDAYHKIQSISQLIDSRKDENVKFQEVLRVHSLLDPKVEIDSFFFFFFHLFFTFFFFLFFRFQI